MLFIDNIGTLWKIITNENILWQQSETLKKESYLPFSDLVSGL